MRGPGKILVIASRRLSRFVPLPFQGQLWLTLAPGKQNQNMYLHNTQGRIAFLYVCGLAAAAAAPCFGVLNATFPFEEVCFELLKGGEGGLQLREYPASASNQGGVTLVAYNASAAITAYQQALTLTSFYVTDYFVGGANVFNQSLLASRTVPFGLRPPSPAHNSWLGFMALAPSIWPVGRKAQPPSPNFDVELVPLGLYGEGPLVIAAQRATLQTGPQPSDFDALCATLDAAVAAQLPAWEVDLASPFTHTHARYYGWVWDGPYDVECWAGVVKK